MGTDIHFNVEARGQDGHWHAIPRPLRDGRRVEFYGERNYTVFGVLAGIRDDDVAPISWPRGLPIDLAQEHADSLEQIKKLRLRRDLMDTDEYGAAIDTLFEQPIVFDPGSHDMSWLTVRELLEYNWPQPYEPAQDETIADYCDDFLAVLHRELLPLGPPDDVRIVFGFDS